MDGGVGTFILTKRADSVFFYFMLWKLLEVEMLIMSYDIKTTSHEKNYLFLRIVYYEYDVNGNLLTVRQTEQ